VEFINNGRIVLISLRHREDGDTTTMLYNLGSTIGQPGLDGVGKFGGYNQCVHF
jgi:hypothetical protein